MPTHFSFLPHDAPTPQPGDLVGFSGRGLLSAAINLGTWGLPGRGLSHVAIVARRRNQLALYESTTTVGTECLEMGRTIDGMQCHPIADRVVGFPGRVWHYPLSRPMDPDQADSLELKLRILCRFGVPYDYRGAFDARSTLIALLVRAKFGENTEKLFCSELVAMVWDEFGVFSTANASEWSPNRLARYAVSQGITGEPIEWNTLRAAGYGSGAHPAAS